MSECSRRQVLGGLAAILAAGCGPALVRVSSLMAIRPMPPGDIETQVLDIFAVRPSRSTGFCEALWKHGLLQKAQALTPYDGARAAVLYLIERGAAVVPRDSTGIRPV